MRMYKVLIAEDDPMVAMINEQYISQNRSFQVVGKCGDGRSAIEFLEKNPVDLVILDVYMPGADGFETLRRVREKKIPVEAIMVTAANDREALEEALHLGVVDYLVKPFTFDRFQASLDKFTAQRSALGQSGALSQKSIDYIIENSRGKNAQALPKGIQETTLDMITGQLGENRGRWLTGDEIAESTGLKGVTVRRYMNYLAETGRVSVEMDYGTGGRPCMKYRMG